VGERTVTEQGTIAIPEAAGGRAAASQEDLDAAVAAVAAQREAWVRTGLEERIALLDRCRDATVAVADEWVAAIAAVKGIDPDTPTIGEAWLSGPVTTLRLLRLLRRTLDEIRRHGAPQVDLDTRQSGQVVARVLPTDRLDSVLFTGMTGEVWLDPRVTLEQARERLGGIHRDGDEDGGGVCLVLGAGNVSSIAPTDALTKLFTEDRVAVIKVNPVLEAVGPAVEAALAPLVDADLVRVVYGGSQVGAYLADHPEVDELHMTGSDKTYEAIVFGTGEEGARRKREDDPRNTRPFTAELGNVTPVIVVPGPWSDRDIAFQGESIASMLTHNAGFNCIAGRVVLTHRRWSKRAPLLDAVRRGLAEARQREPYYPGARDRWQRFADAYPQAEWFGREGDGAVPFTLIPAIDPDGEDLATTTEVFAGVVGEIPLDAPTSIPDFVEQAVRFANERIWGTLGVTIIVHPASMKDPAVKAAVENAVADLRYGTVCVNTWSGVAYAAMSTSWGAFPGHHRTDIGSGTGVVHNTYLLPDVQKSVLRGPFKPPTKPVWFHSHRTLDELAPRVSELEATGDLRLLPSLLWHGVRG
jgi:acyl-CoA reductase-like NAD-dependent aldehyde dehydrogenase